MKITEKMMTAILKKVHDANIMTIAEQAVFITNHVNQTEQILTAINIIHKNQNTIDEQYKRQTQDLNAAIAKIQNECPHFLTDYHPDPSGNSDSYYECRICGKEM